MIIYYFVFSSYEISKIFELNAYISELVLWHLSTSSTTSSFCLEIRLFICFKKMYTFLHVALFDFKLSKFQKIFQKGI